MGKNFHTNSEKSHFLTFHIPWMIQVGSENNYTWKTYHSNTIKHVPFLFFSPNIKSPAWNRASKKIHISTVIVIHSTLIHQSLSECCSVSWIGHFHIVLPMWNRWRVKNTLTHTDTYSTSNSKMFCLYKMHACVNKSHRSTDKIRTLWPLITMGESVSCHNTHIVRHMIMMNEGVREIWPFIWKSIENSPKLKTYNLLAISMEITCHFNGNTSKYQ